MNFVKKLMDGQFDPTKNLVARLVNRETKKARTVMIDTSAAHVNVENILRDKIASRAVGKAALFRSFKMFDLDNSSTIDFTEFYKGCLNMGINLNESDVRKLFDKYKNPGTEHIDYHGFVDRVLQQPLTERMTSLPLKEEDWLGKIPVKPSVHLSAAAVEKGIASKFENDVKSGRMILDTEFQKRSAPGAAANLSFPDFVKSLRSSHIYITGKEARRFYDKFRDKHGRFLRKHFIDHVLPMGSQAHPNFVPKRKVSRPTKSWQSPKKARKPAFVVGAQAPCTVSVWNEDSLKK